MTSVIANRLAAETRTRVDVIAIHAGDPFFELDRRIGVTTLTHERQTSLTRNYARYVRRLRRVLRRERYDYLVDVCTAMSLLSLPASAGLPTRIISWEHFNAGVDWNPVTTPLARWAASRFAHRVVVLTDGDKATFERRWRARNVVRISNPVTIEAGEPSPLSEKRFLAVGRFSPQKGYDLLLDAWARTKVRHDDWKLRIVGSGGEEAAMRGQIERLRLAGSVEILPPTRDVRMMYREASCFVLSSRFEGLPLVLLEAMAMGLPVVSFDCETGPREIVVDNLTGLLVPPEDTEALAAAIDRVAEDWDNRVSMGNAALVRSRLFSLDAIAREWLSLLGDDTPRR
jgi:glycosyltransferase involved in cell wall biosynthesis